MHQICAKIRWLGEFTGKIRSIFAERFDNSPIADTDSLTRFVHTRSAYIAQTSLYGYLKTRMGTSFRVIFEDDNFKPALEASKWRVYAACLSDLVIFAVASIGRDGAIDTDVKVRLAIACHAAAVRATFGPCGIPGLAEQSLREFDRRARFVDWRLAAEGEKAFTASPDALVAHAPVIDEFKELDREIVVNSIRFRWNDVRDQFRRRIDAPAVIDTWRNSAETD